MKKNIMKKNIWKDLFSLIDKETKEFKESILEKYDVDAEYVDEYLERTEEASLIGPFDLVEHRPFQDVCFLSCLVMENGEMIHAELGTLGFVGEDIDPRFVFTTNI